MTSALSVFALASLVSLCNSLTSLFVVCGLFLPSTGCSCLKMIGVKVPKTASVGDTVAIHCLYDLEGQKLYSLKWHFNGSEFYRLYGSKLTDDFSYTQRTTPPSLTSYPSSSSSSRGNKKKNHHRSQQTPKSDKNSPYYYNSNPFSIQLFPVAGVDVDVSVVVQSLFLRCLVCISPAFVC